MSINGNALAHDHILESFVQIGEFRLTANGKVIPDIRRNPHQTACVYAWVESLPEGMPIIRYIGQTARGLSVRASSWLSGPNGQVAAKRIGDVLARGSGMQIWMHEPNAIEVFGAVVWPQHAVEQHLIKHCSPKPIWNDIAARRANKKV